MIRCLLFQISHNLRNQPIRKELLVVGETIQIGRAAGCKILLLDHRVNLHHAVIRHSDEGKLYIESEEGADILVNGSFESSAELTPGMHVFVGPYELITAPPVDDYDLVLSVEMVRGLPDDHEHVSAMRAPVTLAAAGLSKRKPTILLISIIMLISLWFPMMPAISTILPEWVTDLQILINEPWQLGDMTRGHHMIKAKCDTCHQKPFVAVPDKACKSCHKTVAKHVKNQLPAKNASNDSRCAECHHDHRGETGQVIHDEQCVICHAEIADRNEKTKLADVRDFGSDHPAFSLTFRTGPKDLDIVRISQRDKAGLVEKPGLKFSHKVHLDKKGVSSPEGDTVLECRDCHHEAGDGFRPISMQKDCQQSECHALRFKPPMSGRHVPHGSVRNVMTALRDYHVTSIIGKMAAGEKLQCGAGSNQAERALDCAHQNAAANADLLFKADRGCGECHEITPVADNQDAPWLVAPVTITNHWLRNARFPHDKHRASLCTDCHDKALSEKSTDVAIPAIEKCRKCHAGNKPDKNKISSNCINCHNFHNPQNLH